MRTLLTALALLASGCAGERFTTLELDADGSLPPLQRASYVAWVEVDSVPVRVGAFESFPAQLSVAADVPTSAGVLFVTIETTPIPTVPSETRVLEGDSEPEAAPESELVGTVDPTTAQGGFILRTPTDDATAADNDAAGLWFLDVSGGAAKPALELPPAPSGWAWQGWVKTQGKLLSTGRFQAPTGADASCATCGDGSIPAFPGEDFVSELPSDVGPVQLDDGESEVLVTLQPGTLAEDLEGEQPFMPVLTRNIPKGLKAVTTERLEQRGKRSRLKARWGK